MNNIKDTIEQYKTEFLKELDQLTDFKDLEALRVKYIGRQGFLNNLMDQLKNLNIKEKRQFGPILNEFKKEIQIKLEEKKQFIEQKAQELKIYKEANFDVTAYKQILYKGTLHPYSHIIEQVENVFISMGYEIAQGPEVETEYHNFDALNIPKDHPARDIQDTFWLTLPNLLMRTHTSTVQIHQMKNYKPPIAIVSHGRVYRNEATDASHDFMFMQLEGLLIDKNISMGNLIATAKSFLQGIFEQKNLDIRIRPSYFPFVEPGIEFDMSCPFCLAGCAVCKKTRWIEIGGAGLVHPNVLISCNINPQDYSGFAFGLGLTRLTMLKYGITDIRLLHSSKIDFLKQF